jgi:predicted GNAT family acetyltransferase
MTALTVQHETRPEGGAFVLMGDRPLGEMHYVRLGPKLINIDHTQVDDSLRGQGAARKLLDTAVAWARETQTQVKATCPYAKAQFEKDPSICDVLAPKPV